MQRSLNHAGVALFGPLALFTLLWPQVDGWLLASRGLPPPSGASPELRTRLEKLPAPDRRVVAEATPEDRAGWEALQAARDAAAGEAARGLAQDLSVSVERDEIGGVPVFRLGPDEVEPENEDRLFLHVHGGAYVFNSGEAAITEGVLIASRLGIPVVSVDYRMPPAHPFPAALDDVVAVYTSMLGDRPARSIAMGGTSAGGGLVLAVVHKLLELDREVPGVLFAGTPWSDLTKTGDSYFTNEGVDHLLVTYEGLLREAARLYAGDQDLRDPLISPVYGDFEGFPPTHLLTGTRDLFLSNTVRVHSKLRAAGVKADLMVFEGIAHADCLTWSDTSESHEGFAALRGFLMEHLGD